MIERKNKFFDAANFFLIAGLLIGIFYCVAVPYGAGFDEERHLVRMYYMSENEYLPVFSNVSIHQEVFDFSYQRRLVQSPAFDLFSRENFTRRFSESDDLRYGQGTQSIYSPVIFLPQALLARYLWWKFDFPILPTIILIRIVGMAIYVVGGYFGIRKVPFGKWMFALLALSPSAMFQASTLNGDGFTNGIGFAFIGLVLGIYLNEKQGIKSSSLWALVVLSLLLGSAKPGAIILFPLLALLIRHSFPSKKWIVFLGIVLIVSTAFNVGWSVYATNVSTYGQGGEQSVPRQMASLFSDPMGFITPLVQGMVLTFPYQVQGWIAAYGYWAGKVPSPLYLIWVIGLLAAFFAEPQRVTIPRGVRLFLIAFCLFCCVVTYTVAFVGNYATGGVLALAKHGRYYIPYAPMFFLGLAGLTAANDKNRRLAEYFSVGSILLTAVFFSIGIYTTYYAYCGYDAYVGGTCYLPTYKNLEKEDAPQAEIYNGVEVRQTFTNFCGRLQSVSVFIKSVPENSDGKLLFTILDEKQNVVAEEDIPFRDIVSEDYLAIRTDLPPDSRGGEFEIQLTVDSPAPQDTIIALLTRGNYYPGELTVDEIARERNDLLIHYVCAGP
ncbi:MAG TPA: DUF2142 domain-containing protein [Anaerolineales bacterium]|nr:DUF2142 domain-containing protein [Anaerolineales bacterium]HNQ93032.1 DUF2142 domain-containing protein [Anaerolineales bacterium]HNS60382.1 DUF2142 domain-containing protein [Anaerolineales bacterium]